MEQTEFIELYMKSDSLTMSLVEEILTEARPQLGSRDWLSNNIDIAALLARSVRLEPLRLP